MTQVTSMNVNELIQHLSAFDPETEVVVEYDGHFLSVKSVQPQLVLTEGYSGADYPSAAVLEQSSRHPTTADEHAINLQSPQKTVAAIWGTTP
jgi:hypothetical protein